MVLPASNPAATPVKESTIDFIPFSSSASLVMKWMSVLLPVPAPPATVIISCFPLSWAARIILAAILCIRPSDSYGFTLILLFVSTSSPDSFIFRFNHVDKTFIFVSEYPSLFFSRSNDTTSGRSACWICSSTVGSVSSLL